MRKLIDAFSLRRRAAEAPKWSGPADARAYAIGDVHGRLDLLQDLLAKIEADNAARPATRVWVVLLGDIIDRGPDSAGVVDLLLNRFPAFAQPVVLMGNHEEMLLHGLSGHPETLPRWLQYGGLECAQSYGVPSERLVGNGASFVEAELKHAIPKTHLDFLAASHDTFRFGDYLFVHAGIRPGVLLEEQRQRDLRWIREGFLDCDDDHGMVVIHGHTIVDDVERHENRIAIDLGAYRTGRLGAIGVEGKESWLLESTGASAEGSARWTRG